MAEGYPSQSFPLAHVSAQARKFFSPRMNVARSSIWSIYKIGNIKQREGLVRVHKMPEVYDIPRN
jgi:hypothetical protein